MGRPKRKIHYVIENSGPSRHSLKSSLREILKGHARHMVENLADPDKHLKWAKYDAEQILYLLNTWLPHE